MKPTKQIKSNQTVARITSAELTMRLSLPSWCRVCYGNGNIRLLKRVLDWEIDKGGCYTRAVSASPPGGWMRYIKCNKRPQNRRLLQLSRSFHELFQVSFHKLVSLIHCFRLSFLCCARNYCKYSYHVCEVNGMCVLLHYSPTSGAVINSW